TARRLGLRGPVLAERPPYATSQAYGVETVPTTVLVDPAGARLDSVVGWDRAALERLLAEAARLRREPPLRPDGAGPEPEPGCSAGWTYDAGGAGLDELEEMWERGWTDGLPTVPPTPERVEAMLGGLDGARSLGAVPPALGEATLERVAACAVLAGCRPAYF